MSSVKYIYKYIHKGEDRAVITLEPVVAPVDAPPNNVAQPLNAPINDEIKRYVDCRYISSSEAIWRILEYELSYRSPSITRLSVHEPNHQRVVFLTGQAEQATATAKPTELMAYLNQVRIHVYPP